MNARLLAVCLNPTLQKTICLDELKENEVNRSGEYRLDASGKGVNVARVLVQLGRPAVHLTHAGGRWRELFLSLAAADGLQVVAPDSGSEIRHCYTLLSRKAGTTTEIVEEAEAVGPGTEDAVRSRYDELLPDCRAVIFSGTKAAGYSAGLYPELVAKARRAGKPVVLDVRGKDLLDSLPHRPDVIKPNLAEFVATFMEDGMPSEHAGDARLEAAVREKMREISGRYGCAVVLTRGSRGALWQSAGAGESGDAPGERVAARNTTGSGDAFTAGFTAAWLDGAGLPAAIARGHWCGARNAELLKPGVIR